ncbi:putative chaperon-like protein for quinone binding in photosystem II [Prochlorococcus marinus subsp. pastoris str. CCMP1986]|uniref:Putative chaperon-like protein for quinone binding in photosystem II n=1 Tax=Prochlorococcus marinus subsp. pastoris (strain CCMP1986 / NIES-2087 / MED4) TaxID=59919 RepID=Q7V0V0_PROMP|nr:NAD(P)H-binding protein [Prochlorococcus marinus]KGF87294.1 putative chaperon-like protein Ycf39 for quinone binding in Photosystem II [Prochlorococcus marinus str. EQPAC1]CAE19611.1 putative chaperon-like protein for quinone binding in photosystem II [Prochlorococcus marinus subsp. pastoris str. CCMP1986]
MKILLVGATGTLGRQIAKQAIEEGHEVRCFVRNPRKASFLQEWGCELTKGNLLNSGDIDYALQDIEVVIDSATGRPEDSKSIYETDWDGKLNLFNACESKKIKRVIFLSILSTEKFRNVPLMDVKYCTEKLLEKSNFDYTIFKCAAFMQGVISQFAIPVLDSQAVWMSGTPTKIAYMNTQDMAKIIVSSINKPKSYKRSLPLVGPKAWDSDEVISLCEKYSNKKAKIFRVSPFLIKVTQNVVSFFQDALNVSERLAFAEVTSSGVPLDDDMSNTYELLELKKEDSTSLESYIKEYYQQILKRLKEMEADLNIEEKKRLPF